MSSNFFPFRAIGNQNPRLKQCKNSLSKVLQKNSSEVALDFLAAGLDPKKAIFFRQSDIPFLNELAWILSTVAPMGLLERCHAYKNKVAKGLPASLGLFSYPVLMAADILAYDTDVVPVGRDQKQHIEVTRDLAIKINEIYGGGEVIFKLPEAKISESTAIIPGTDGAKMSKSYGNTIELFLEEGALRKKIMALQTDSTPVDQPKSLENSVILGLYRLVATAAEVALMEEEFTRGGIGYGSFKKRLFEQLWEYLAPLRQRRKELEQDRGYLEEVLQAGAQRAQEIAAPVMERVRRAVGLRGAVH